LDHLDWLGPVQTAGYSADCWAPQVDRLGLPRVVQRGFARSDYFAGNSGPSQPRQPHE
jgi:hypothetical protein